MRTISALLLYTFLLVAAVAQTTTDDLKPPQRAYPTGGPDSGPVQLLQRQSSPDPSILTTQQLDRALVALELRLTTRITGIEKAQDKFDADFTRVPTITDRAVANLQSLLEDKIDKLDKVSGKQFDGIVQQFLQRDKQTEQLAVASSTAIAAALQAQKEAATNQNAASAAAIAKSEATTAEAIRQLQILLQAGNSSTNDKIAALASRLDRGEGSSTGLKDGWGYLVGAVGSLIAIIGLGFSISMAVSRGRDQHPVVVQRGP